MSEPVGPIPQGTWQDDCVQRAFVAGAEWWQFHANGSTMFGSERDEAEQEAVKRYGSPVVPAAPKKCSKCGAAGETFTADLDWCQDCHHQWPGT